MIWMEIRCERRGDGRRDSNLRCLSDSNTGPMGPADETITDVINTKRAMEEEAISYGWKKIRGEGWVCPNCIEYVRIK